MAVRSLRILGHVPFVKKWAQRFAVEKKESLERVDAQIAELHRQRKTTFYASLGLEFTARVVGCLEVYFILNILTSDVSFLACILIMAFTSLFANLFFFHPCSSERVKEDLHWLPEGWPFPVLLAFIPD